MEKNKASTRNVVVDFLLGENYLLTAFELYHELLEDGQAAAAAKLHSFFADRDTFPPEQMRALQSIDAQLLASGRPAVAEDELRLAREDILSLQEQLESLRKGERATGVRKGLASSSAELRESGFLVGHDNGDSNAEGTGLQVERKRSYRILSPAGDTERRDLICAVKEFLVSEGCKLTAMMLHEEVDQDLDNWANQVPDALRRYYLAFLSSSVDAVEEKTALKSENAALLKAKEDLGSELLSVTKTKDAFEVENVALLKAKQELGGELQSVTRSLEAAKKDAKEKDRQFRQLKESFNVAENQLNEFRSEVTSLKLELEMANRGGEQAQQASSGVVAAQAPEAPETSEAVEISVSSKVPEVPQSSEAPQAPEGLEVPEKTVPLGGEEGAEIPVNGSDLSQFSDSEEEVDADARAAFGSPIHSRSGTVKEETTSSVQSTTATNVNGHTAEPGEEDGFKSMLTYEEQDANESHRGGLEERPHEAELHTVRILADALPRIVPYVLINYREELLPLIICAIERHPEDTVRDGLTNLLFNLIKRPDEKQRRVIMDACLTLAKNVGEERTETELLPQCWEQIDHKYEERRVLVAQSCGELGQFVRAEMRPSLILSIVQQLMDDEAGVVREAAAHNLALMLPLFPNLDKFSKVEEILSSLVCDPAGNVAETSLKQLLPAVIEWSKPEKKQLLSHLLGALLSRLVGSVQRCPPVSAVQDSLEFQLRVLGEREIGVADALLRTLIELLPEVRKIAFETCPFPDIFFEDEEDLEAFFSEDLLKFYSRSDVEWPDFDWLSEDCFPALLHVATMLPSREEGLRTRLSNLVRTVGKLFGETYLTTIVLPIFLMASGDFADTSHLSSRLTKRIKGFKPSTPKAEQLARICVLPLLLAGVLGAPNMPGDHLSTYLRNLVLQSSLTHGSWSSVQSPELIDAVRFLCSFKEHLDVIVGVLWDLVVNPNSKVKATAAVLFKAFVPYVGLKMVTQQVLPALVTLGSDTNLNVRYASIDAFGAVAQHFTDGAVVEKIRVQMDAFLDDDGSHEATIAVVRALAAAVPLAESSLRDYLLQKLLILSAATNQNSNVARRKEKVDAFCEAIQALDATDLSAASVKDLLLPTIQNLLKDMDALDPAHKEALEVIVRDRAPGLRLDLLSKHLRKTSMGGLFGEGGYLGAGSSSIMTPTTIPESVALPETPAPASAQPAEGRLKFWRNLRGTSSET